MSARKPGWAIWVVGQPGCGKSSLVRGMHEVLVAQGHDPVVLEMDERRKKYFPEPTYSAEEREQAYTMFVDDVTALVQEGRCVIMDGAAYKVAMREYGRQQIDRFAEITVICDLDEAIRRESARPEGKVMAGLYRKALERRETGRVFPGLGEVIGVDVDFEMNPDAELFIDNTELTPDETLRKALHFLDSWLSDD